LGVAAAGGPPRPRSVEAAVRAASLLRGLRSLELPKPAIGRCGLIFDMIEPFEGKVRGPLP